MSRRGYGGLSILMSDRDFQEEEVWDVYNTHITSPPKSESFASDLNSSSHQRATRTSSLSRMFDGNKSYRVNTIRQSVPVSIPNWSKFYDRCGSPTDSKKAADDENEDDGGWEVYEVPPHEWLERKHSRRQSFSVMEGAGRTLKGRDLSKVRDSVLTRTGFIE